MCHRFFSDHCLKKKKFFSSHPIFLLQLKSYNFLLSCFMPPSLICFPKLLALVTLLINNQIQKCDTSLPQWSLPFILWSGRSEGQTVFVAPFSSIGCEWGSPVCQNLWGWVSELLDSPWLSLCLHAQHNTRTHTQSFMHTGTDGARDIGHCGFSGDSRWWIVSARLFNRTVPLGPAKLRTYPQSLSSAVGKICLTH